MMTVSELMNILSKFDDDTLITFIVNDCCQAEVNMIEGAFFPDSDDDSDQYLGIKLDLKYDDMEKLCEE